MTKSKLVSYTKLSPNNSGARTSKVCKITPHHMAGNLTVEQCGEVFAPASRQASSNYGIGTDGRIACYVEEENRAWTSASAWNDNQAITIEVANSYTGGEWPVSDAAWSSLVKLCADICRRYGFRLEYTGDKYGTLTEHRMFAKTSCPGQYLHERMGELARQVNAMVDNESGDDDMAAIDVWTYKNAELNGNNDAYQLLTDIHNAVTNGGIASWSYRNKALEKVDVYQIVRDSRDFDKKIWNKVCGIEKAIAEIKKN